MGKVPLPAFYYYFFGVFEPTLTLIGAYLAIVTPGHYAADLLPTKFETVTRIVGDSVRGQMLIGGLGSCFLLLAMINVSIFATAKLHLGSNPVAQGQVVRALLIPLAIADLTHIATVLLPLPMSLLTSPSKWSTTLHGNISITLFLFIVRSAYFIGIGRKPRGQETKRRKSHGQAGVPLPPARVIGSGTAAEKVVKEVEQVERSPVKRRVKRA